MWQTGEWTSFQWPLPDRSTDSLVPLPFMCKTLGVNAMETDNIILVIGLRESAKLVHTEIDWPSPGTIFIADSNFPSSAVGIADLNFSVRRPWQSPLIKIGPLDANLQWSMGYRRLLQGHFGGQITAENGQMYCYSLILWAFGFDSSLGLAGCWYVWNSSPRNAEYWKVPVWKTPILRNAKHRSPR